MGVPTRGVMHNFALRTIRFYQAALSPYLGGHCRFTPSCSEYAHDAIQTHGVAGGVWLAAKRLARCRPFGASGYDPVPQK